MSCSNTFCFNPYDFFVDSNTNSTNNITFILIVWNITNNVRFEVLTLLLQSLCREVHSIRHKNRDKTWTCWLLQYVIQWPLPVAYYSVSSSSCDSPNSLNSRCIHDYIFLRHLSDLNKNVTCKCNSEWCFLWSSWCSF